MVREELHALAFGGQVVKRGDRNEDLVAHAAAFDDDARDVLFCENSVEISDHGG